MPLAQQGFAFLHAKLVEEVESILAARHNGFGLDPGRHELRLVVRGEPYVEAPGIGSRGAEIPLTGLVVFE